MGVIKALTLDFDNFILLDPATGEGSEEIKDRAWFEVFREFEATILGSIIEQAKQDMAGGHGDRKDIAMRVLKHFGRSETLVQAKCQEFEAIVQKGIREMGISSQDKNALSKLSERMPMFVNSATPLSSVLPSLTALGVLNLFKGIYGRPQTKLQNLQMIIAAERIRPHEMLFGDDQDSGRLVAAQAGCKFVGMITRRNKLWHRPNLPFPTIRDLSGLLTLI